MAAKTKSAGVRQLVHLTFPENLIKEPVLSLLSRKFDIIFNIRGSTVTSEMGLVVLELDGKAAEVARAIAWLKAKGVVVEPIVKSALE